MIRLITAVLVFMSSSAFARPVVCTADHLFVDAAGKTEAKAKFSFDTQIDASGLPVLKGFNGRLTFPNYLLTKLKGTTKDELIDATYKIATVKSNPKYRPTKYKDSYQFKNIQPTKDDFSLYGINLIIAKSAYSNYKPFDAVLIVDIDQNGARMVLSCK